MEVSYKKKKAAFVLEVEDMQEFIEMQLSLRTYVTTIDEWIKSYEEMVEREDYQKDKEEEVEKLRNKKCLIQSLLNDFKQTVYK